eukprot:326455_1
MCDSSAPYTRMAGVTEPQEIELIQESRDKARDSLSKGQIDMQTKQNIEQSWKDEKRAKSFNWAKYAVLSLSVLAYMGYSYYLYNNEVNNSIQRSTSEIVSEYEIPYIIFVAAPKLYDMHIYGVQNGYQTYLNGSGLETESLTDFVYDSSKTSWTVLESQNRNGSVLLVIPPYGSTLEFGKLLGFEVWSYAKCVESCTSYYDYYDDSYYDVCQNASVNESVNLHMTDQENYGIYWVFDSAKNLQELLHIQGAMESVIENTAFMGYVFISTNQYVELTLVEEIDEWKNTHDHIYNTRVTATKTDKSKSLDVTPLQLGYCYVYINHFYFYINQGGIKTTITRSRLKGVLELASDMGSNIRNLATVLTVSLGLILFGSIYGKCKPMGLGLAKNVGLDEKEKLKIALYLQELGILTQKQYQETVEYEQMFK